MLVSGEVDGLNAPELDKKMSILFISGDRYPPFRVDVATLFGKKLIERGHRIDWILQSKEPCKRSYQTKWRGSRVWVGANCERTGVFSILKSHALELMNCAKMFRLLKDNSYDFVQVKDKFLCGIMAVIAAKLYHRKLIYWSSWPYPEESLYTASSSKGFTKWYYHVRGLVEQYLLYKVILGRAKHIFVQSEQMRIEMNRMGIDMNKMTPVPMGVSLEDIPYDEAGQNTLAQPTDRKIVAYLGTLSRSRRMDFLIRAFSFVNRKLPESELLLIGGSDDPKDIEQLKNEAVLYGVEGKVIITGFMPIREAWGEFMKADVGVAPLYPTPILNMCSPTKLVEYMAMGKATVASDHPDQSRVISESGAGICVGYDEEQFAVAILSILSDPNVAKEMGKKGRCYVTANRNYDIIAANLERSYYELIHETQ